MKASKAANFIFVILLVSLLISCGRERTSTTDVKLEDSDKVFMNEVFFEALNEAISEDRREWYNSETGNAGAIVMEATYLNTSGLYCRRFKEEVEIPIEPPRYWYLSADFTATWSRILVPARIELDCLTELRMFCDEKDYPTELFNSEAWPAYWC